MPTSTKTGVDPGLPYREAMREMIATQWAAVWKAIPAVMESDDPAAVHKVRVASRRLRAAMDIATDCFPCKWYRPLHKTAKAITRALGEVRDRDVQLEELTREREQARDEALPGIDYLIAEITRERKHAREAMLMFLAKLESKHIRKETKRRFGHPTDTRKGKQDLAHATPKRQVSPPQNDHPGALSRNAVPTLDPMAPLATNARRVLVVRTDDLIGYAPIIPDAGATEQLHDARIATKRLRYTLELFPTVFGEEGAQIITLLQALQEELGQLHDHDVRLERMEADLAVVDEQPDASVVRPSLEGLLGAERATRATQHGAVIECWRRLERKQVQERLSALSRLPG
jgi:CHAD domain-containing protein